MNKEKLQDILKQPGLKVFNRKNSQEFRDKMIYIDSREIRFANSVGDWMGIKQGSKISFLRLDEDWYMGIDEDNDKDSYHVNRDTKYRSGCRISSAYIRRAILSSIAPGKNNIRCTIERSERFEYKGKPVYKICK